MNKRSAKKIQLLSRLPGLRYSYFMQRRRSAMPVNITISLLYSCNSRCQTCNVYEKKVKNFTVEEYEKTFASIGRSPYWFTMSGGEPFLRKDIADVCRAAEKYCQPGIINIPTNGSLNKVLADRAEDIISSLPDTDIIINLSLDGIEDEHDKIRGFPGSWERSMVTYERLNELRQKYSNFTLGIHTVISNFNVSRFKEIYAELIKMNPDSYITEIAEERVELGTIGEPITPDFEEYTKAVDFLTAEMKKQERKGLGKIAQSFRYQYYELVKEFLREPHQVIPCFAGIVSAQISPDGDVWPCCIRADSMGSLREADYDFKKIWYSREAASIRRSIKNRECSCPLANAAYTNMLVSPKSIIKIAGRLLK